MKQERYLILDEIRGFTLLNMFFYHGIWDLVYLFGFDWGWYRSGGVRLWQQAICWTFILLSGFCMPLGKHKLKRGLQILFLSTLISAVTLLFTPKSQVLFGILSLLGSCMLLMIPLEKLLEKCPAPAGFLLCMLLFFLTRPAGRGYLGLGEYQLFDLPASWYNGFFSAYLGFPPENFFSTDYFPIFPWIFLFLSGFFLHKILASRNLMPRLKTGNQKSLIWLGQHSLLLYAIHQPVLYLILNLVF